MLAMELHTPPIARAVPGIPTAMEEPGVCCTLGELRLWVVAKISESGTDATDLEIRAAGCINTVAATADEAMARTNVLDTAVVDLTGRANAALTDVGVSGAIKNFVT